MFASGGTITIPPMVSAFTRGIGWMTENICTTVAASAATGAETTYMPIFLPAPCILRRVWWANGASVNGAATVECGLYANGSFAPTTKIVSGSALQGSASQLQFVDVTDTSLASALYWIAVVTTATDARLFRALTTISAKVGYTFDESVTALPATATPRAPTSTYGTVYLCGFATTATP